MGLLDLRYHGAYPILVGIIVLFVVSFRGFLIPRIKIVKIECDCQAMGMDVVSIVLVHVAKQADC